MIPQLENKKGRIHIETQATEDKIYYVINFVTMEGLQILGKRLETDSASHPLLILRQLHLLIKAVEQKYIEHEICLRPL